MSGELERSETVVEMDLVRARVDSWSPETCERVLAFTDRPWSVNGRDPRSGRDSAKRLRRKTSTVAERYLFFLTFTLTLVIVKK